MQGSLYWSLHTGMGMGCVLAVTAVLAASLARDTWALPFPVPHAEENEALLSNWVDSWTKQAAGAATIRFSPTAVLLSPPLVGYDCSTCHWLPFLSVLSGA